VRMLLSGIGLVVLIGVVLWVLNSQGTVSLSPKSVAESMGYVIAALAVAYFGYQLIFGGFNAIEKKRIVVILVLFIAATMFWCGFEQAGSSMNLFAKDHTNRIFFGSEMPASWLQSVNALMIIC